ncbi:hypothetical protein BU23DRAFT_658898 [Bimuria novae-zelandiae CBS 107.79]|uniref:Bacteriophage T5 Orf172 DNA-binding domain-containing protein n=1 Tax=Bimuria novae-zelandiae CBS 107.79 TaxID=1447943 RepID=A0A6A5UUR9_9PLEO|nr:hypothetical protein BU23DRAFT_658898 [Bimuria novae-zelandiae CBS 107.79]
MDVIQAHPPILTKEGIWKTQFEHISTLCKLKNQLIRNGSKRHLHCLYRYPNEARCQSDCSSYGQDFPGNFRKAVRILERDVEENNATDFLYVVRTFFCTTHDIFKGGNYTYHKHLLLLWLEASQELRSDVWDALRSSGRDIYQPIPCTPQRPRRPTWDFRTAPAIVISRDNEASSGAAPTLRELDADEVTPCRRRTAQGTLHHTNDTSTEKKTSRKSRRSDVGPTIAREASPPVDVRKKPSKTPKKDPSPGPGRRNRHQVAKSTVRPLESEETLSEVSEQRTSSEENGQDTSSEESEREASPARASCSPSSGRSGYELPLRCSDRRQQATTKSRASLSTAIDLPKQSDKAPSPRHRRSSRTSPSPNRNPANQQPPANKQTPASPRRPEIPNIICADIRKHLTAPLKTTPGTGSLYILAAPKFFSTFKPAVAAKEQWVKIGYAREVKQRVKEISRVCAIPDLYAVWTSHIDNERLDLLKRIEKVCHAQLANFNRRWTCEGLGRGTCRTLEHTEWFAVDTGTAIGVAEMWMGFLNRRPYENGGLRDVWRGALVEGEGFQLLEREVEWTNEDVVHQSWKAWIRRTARTTRRSVDSQDGHVARGVSISS